MTLLRETPPGQFEMKALGDNIWWPHLSREIYHHGKNCGQCIKAGANQKAILGTNNTQENPDLSKP